MKHQITEQLRATKEASRALPFVLDETIRSILCTLAKKLTDSCVFILQENAKDVDALPKEDPMRDRLLLTQERVFGIAKDLLSVADLPSLLGKSIETRLRPNGLRIEKVVVPLGVVAVIYESRPNVTVDVFALCLKTKNACVLKGGNEAQHSNKILVDLIQGVLRDHGVDPQCVVLLPPIREAASVLMEGVGLIDMCIPRGSQSLIDFVRQHARVPVIETGAGVVHIYFDKSGDVQKGRLIIQNAKTRRVSVCNALDSLIIHESRLESLPGLIEPLKAHHVDIFADPKSYEALQPSYPFLYPAREEDFGQEFLSYKLSIKTVGSEDEAIDHISRYSSGHSEGIITEDSPTSFVTRVDAAVVYVNASTAFTDGGEFGMGTEIGISTQKMHARGPMGLEALTSYTWVVFGDGHVRG